MFLLGFDVHCFFLVFFSNTTSDFLYLWTHNFLYLGTPNSLYLGTPNFLHLSTPKFLYLWTPNFLYLETPKLLHLETPNFLYLGTPNLRSFCIPFAFHLRSKEIGKERKWNANARASRQAKCPWQSF